MLGRVEQTNGRHTEVASEQVKALAKELARRPTNDWIGLDRVGSGRIGSDLI